MKIEKSRTFLLYYKRIEILKANGKVQSMKIEKSRTFLLYYKRIEILKANGNEKSINSKISIR